MDPALAAGVPHFLVTALQHRLRTASHALTSGRGPSPIHALDARIKIAVTALFLGVTASFPPYAPGDLAPLLFFPCVLGALAGIPGKEILGRALLLSPLVLLLGAAEPFLHRTPVPLAPGIAVAAGWFSLLGLAIKFVLSVSGTLLLVRTTSLDDLCSGLVQLRIPRVLALQLLLLVRYLFLLGDEALRTLRAHGARTGGASPSLALAGPLLGTLLLRTVARGERISRAMVAREFGAGALEGAAAALDRRNLLFLGSWGTFFLLVRLVPLSVFTGSGGTP